VDYWDLVALAILPACAKFAASEPRSFVSSAALRRWLLPPVLAATLFGVMATQTFMPPADFSVRAVESSAPFPRDDIVASIKQIARARGLKQGEANPPYWQGSFRGSGILLTYTFREPSEIVVGLQVDRGLFGDGELRKAAKLRAEIQKSLSLRFKGLEFVDTRPKP
jgi:hypothetical protein